MGRTKQQSLRRSAPPSPQTRATNEEPSSDADEPSIQPRGGDASTSEGGAVGRREVDGGLLSASPWQLATKRAIDILGASLVSVLLLPLLLVTSLAILCTSRGGVLYRQTRVGRDGRPFRIIKFRTMHRDAHDLMPEYEDLNELDGPIFKMRRDPRVTRIGRTIRKFSIDELPQLVNVLQGTMSLVGPRPLVPEEYRHLDAYESQRLLATPGLTGLWQVSGRNDVDFHRWIEMDLDYIRNWNLRLDLALVVRTVPAVLLARGSY